MATHSEIITIAGGAHELAQKIAASSGEEAETVRKRVWAWFRSDSIPGEYWPFLARQGFATEAELGAAAEARKLPVLAAAAEQSAQPESSAA